MREDARRDTAEDAEACSRALASLDDDNTAELLEQVVLDEEGADAGGADEEDAESAASEGTVSARDAEEASRALAGAAEPAAAQSSAAEGEDISEDAANTEQGSADTPAPAAGAVDADATVLMPHEAEPAASADKTATTPSVSDETISLSDLPADASLTRELPGLGSAPAVEKTVAAGSIPVPMPPTAREVRTIRRRHRFSRRTRILIIAGVIVVAVGGGCGAYYAWQGYQTQQAALARATAHTMMHVTLGVDVPGLDASTGTKIPLRVTGQDRDGTVVTETAYVDQNGEGLALFPGDYTVTAAASPIAGDGTIYSVPSDGIDIKVAQDGQNLKSAGTLSFTVPAANTVSDDAIKTAYTYASQGGAPSDARAQILRQAATDRRDAAARAVAQRKTLERREEDERHKATPAYSVDIPEAWYGKVNTWQNGNTLCMYLAGNRDLPLCTLTVEHDGYNQGDANNGVLGAVSLGNGTSVTVRGPVYPWVIAQTLNGRTDKSPDTYSMKTAVELVQLQTGYTYTYDQIKNDLVNKKGDPDAATKLVKDYFAQVLLPSIKAA